MKSQFKKGESENVWYLVIFGDAELLRKFANIWKNIRAKIEKNTGDIVQYDKDYMRTKFESNDNLPTDNIVNMHQVIIIIRSLFAQNGKLYPQLFFRWCTIMYYKNVTISKNVSEGIDVNKTSASKEYELCHYWFY